MSLLVRVGYEFLDFQTGPIGHASTHTLIAAPHTILTIAIHLKIYIYSGVGPRVIGVRASERMFIDNTMKYYARHAAVQSRGRLMR